MSGFITGPKPKTLLGYHRVLSPSASIKVSPICLGTMNFGDAWYVKSSHPLILFTLLTYSSLM
jgi:hypothetical protein